MSSVPEQVGMLSVIQKKCPRERTFLSFVLFTDCKGYKGYRQAGKRKQ
jgi:hypothetical protein